MKRFEIVHSRFFAGKNGIVLLASMAVACAFLHPASADASKILDDVKVSVRSGWKSLAKCSDGIAELREERKTLPDSRWWWTDKSDKDKEIRKQLRRVRELLLSTTAQKILKAVDDLDEDIAEIDEDIRNIQAERQLADDEDKKKYTEKLDKLAGKPFALVAVSKQSRGGREGLCGTAGAWSHRQRQGGGGVSFHRESRRHNRRRHRLEECGGRG